MSMIPNAPDGAVTPAKAYPQRVERTLLQPTLDSGWQVEYSVHRLNNVLAADAKVTFQHELEGVIKKLSDESGKSLKDVLGERLLGIPTWQPAPNFAGVQGGKWAEAVLDLSVYPSQEVNKVRKALYLKVYGWVGAVRKNLSEKGIWCDAVCPITGHCMYGDRTANVFNELEGLTMMLGYDSIPIGCCGIVLHPKWYRNAYPTTMFTTATVEELQQAIKEVGQSPEMPTIIDEAAKECVDGDSCL
eukprot:CAMPEP_0173418280 /NCGR_PEP_ID=MMETSP1357-20121228/485_1 /TAXON_ID=77926 /ORGANISM="Hemiselmis rufescens, Strain PCC563" /LENGTH=244 /DNA_ID=CAMNT_0014380751 /DNA_START=33 /DNA_END=767 /DNA_ORIENTATION=-